jgi:hypothetical protein
MARPRSTELVEEYSVLSVKELFLRSSGTVGHVDVYDAGGVATLRYWTRSDDNGMIEANGRQWFVEYIPRSTWPDNRGEYYADYLVHSPSTRQRHRYLLIAEDGRVCTRSELSPRYYSERRQRKPRRIAKRAAIIRVLMLNTRPNDMTLYFIPMPSKPSQQKRWKYWEKEVRRKLGWQYVPVRRPYGMRQREFMRLLGELNKHHYGRKRGKDAKTKRELDRLFG